MARGGQMVDASIVQTPRQSINKDEKAIVGENAMPAGWKPAKRRQKDIDEEARQVLLRLQALGQCRQALQAHSQVQGQHRQRARCLAL